MTIAHVRFRFKTGRKVAGRQVATGRHQWQAVGRQAAGRQAASRQQTGEQQAVYTIQHMLHVLSFTPHIRRICKVYSAYSPNLLLQTLSNRGTIQQIGLKC